METVWLNASVKLHQVSPKGENNTTTGTDAALGSHLPILQLENQNSWNEPLHPSEACSHSYSQGVSWLTAWIFGKSRDKPTFPEKQFRKTYFMYEFPLGKMQLISLRY